MSNLLTSITGLKAAQRALETVQHNISNVNTEGYSRQRVEQGTMPANLTGSGYIGQGVNVTNVTRSYDQFVNKQLSSSLSAFGEADRYHRMAAQVDNIMADPSTGISPVMNRFFNSINEVANDPSSVPARQVMLSEAEILTESFNAMSGRFDTLRTQNNNDMIGMVKDINSYATAIAELNLQISQSLGSSQGTKQPNDLLDQQDALIAKLSEIVNVTALPQQNGMSSIFIGNGQALVLDGSTSTFTMMQSKFDLNRLEVGLVTKTGVMEITSQLSGGSLVGALRFRDEVLDPAQQKLGRVAVGLAMEVNTLHESGRDLNGEAGEAFFSFASGIPVVENPLNGGNASVTVEFKTPSAAGELDFSDYRLEFVGPDYTLMRMRDKQVTTLTATETGVGTNIFTLSSPSGLPGINITVDQNLGAASGGDQFLIRPTYTAAQKIGVNIDDPRKIAAATEGTPATPAPGDNRNALKMAELANQLIMVGGKASFNDAYNEVVADVGTSTRAGKLRSSAQETMLNQAKGARESLAGVNLDEEAANLIKFQQAYQASAQAISVARSLFDTLIGALR
ncbi:MAG: flagellar hook-associated protein FlgK [Methylobacter sp.]|nr:flagellar hook-associated protein FlgK [Methylobacter sp.]MDP2428023.1 flagellar hook-associated protein FlgK [Methylobacter sp.]MDP3055919.1 flagellar hook-associated protein FlgK [Methylobacter sp.]MDP3363077.1 flagellar hook-associated protein FlgK [Methylobacter sp.]MDZ4219648.1 flagellar hook-associated protein FlgK [Methylobacter sp.]